MEQYFLKIKIPDGGDIIEHISSIKLQYPNLPHFLLTIERSDKERCLLTLILTDGELMNIHVSYKDEEANTKGKALVDRVKQLNRHAYLYREFAGFTNDDFINGRTTTQLTYNFQKQ